MNGYINDLLQNKSKRVDELFFLDVHDPCENINHHMLDTYEIMFHHPSMVLCIYIFNNIIVELTSYCSVDQYIFAANVSVYHGYDRNNVFQNARAQ